MTSTFLFDGPDSARHTILFAHGAGGPMDSPFLSAMSHALAAEGLRVARFEFHYMAARRSGIRKPPTRAEKLIPEFIAAIDALGARGPLIIGGKSLGGRVASMAADEPYASGRISGLLCLGYPFHPSGKPGELRTGHLVDLKTPTLIIQGARDPFGNQEEAATYNLSSAIELHWLEDGDHDLKPRQSISGYSSADHLKTMAEAVSTWAKRITS
jgi:uncharacterized protein